MATPPEPIAFIDLKAQQARIRPRIEARFTAILDHGAYINGPEVAELEAELCAFTGASKALAAASGTDALMIPMMAMDLGKADGVPTAIYYAQPLPQMAAFAPYAQGQSFPESERLAGRVLSLPMHPYLTDDQANYVCDRFVEAVGQLVSAPPPAR